MWSRLAARGNIGARMTMKLRSQQPKRTLATAVTPVEETRELAVAAATERPAKKPRHSAKPAATIPILQHEPQGCKDQILYRYPTLVPARLLRRYKRFLADVVLVDADDEDNENEVDETKAITIYCPNTGPMVGLLDEPNGRVQLSKSDDPKRKYAYTLEMVRLHNGGRHVWVGVHSASANYMVEKAIQSGWFTPQLGAFDVLQREVRFAKNSRVDFVLSKHDDDGDVVHQKYVEVKSVTLAWPTTPESTGRCAVFPDTVSDRASKHVTELIELIETRKRENEKRRDGRDQPNRSKKCVELSGAIVFVVQRDDCESFMPSLVHDKKFAGLCAEAEACGIQLLAFACRLEPNETAGNGHVRLLDALPLHPTRATTTDADDALTSKPKAAKASGKR